jgi:hypothetical protein
MARNGSGTYAIPNTYSDGQTITAAVVNANFSDIGSELTNSVARDGQTSMTGPLKAAPGSAAAPSLTFAADLDTGFFRKAANAIGIAVGGSEIAYIDEYGLSDATTGTTVVNVLRYIPTSEHAAIEAYTSTTNVATYIQAAIDAAAAAPRGVVFFPAGRYRCTADLTVPCGDPAGWRGAVDLVGQGMLGNTEIELSGASIVNGVYFNGSSYSKAGAIRNLAIIGANSAVRGVTFSNCAQPLLERVLIWGFVGHGLKIQSCIMPTIHSSLIYSCGTASLAQVLVTGDGGSLTTTTHSFTALYLGGGRSGCRASLEFRQAQNGVMNGGAIETAGISIMIDNDATFDGDYSTDLTFVGVSMENPTTHFIDIGYGNSSVVSGTRQIYFLNCSGTTSSSTTVAYFAKIKNAIGVTFNNSAGGLSSGAEVAYFELEGTCQGIEITPNRASYGTIPWVREGGTQRNDATPLAYWYSDHMNYLEVKDPTSKSGTSIDCRISAQGGILKFITLDNAGATNLDTITGGMAYAEIILFSIGAGTTTLKHSAPNTANRIKTLTGSDVVMTGAKQYHLRWRPDFQMFFVQTS